MENFYFYRKQAGSASATPSGSGTLPAVIMKSLQVLIVMVLSVSVFGQAKDTIEVVKRQKKYYLTKTCYDILEWDEVRLKDKKVEQKINSLLRSSARAYQLDTTESEIVADRCKGIMGYDVECKAIYAKNGLLSYVFTSHTYFEGAPHGERNWKVSNLDVKTGELVYFWDLFDKGQETLIDSFLYQRLKARLQTTDDLIREDWVAQFGNELYFEIGEKGITIDYIGNNYATSLIDIFLTYEEIRPYVKLKGPLRPFYDR